MNPELDKERSKTPLSECPASSPPLCVKIPTSYV